MKYVKPEEFACSCCNENKINLYFVDRLNEARKRAGVPFVINSGYRCKAHNAAVGGVPATADSRGSSHLHGVAADIRADNSPARWQILDSLMEEGFTRFGIGKDFLHVDMDAHKPQGVIWVYS